ncbi:hypothetical protein J132_04306 [Termitomyces sp. J132]|nr:hypothetical protein J132_04306 [Termitomyces sp. J132]
MMFANKKSGYPHCPIGLRHIDTADNSKALYESSFNGSWSATDIAPPTESIDGRIDDEQVDHGELQKTDALNLKDSELRYFLPSGLLEDDEAEEIALLQSLDLKASITLRRPCDAPCCLRARAYKTIDDLSQKGCYNYGTGDLFLPVSSSVWSSSSSDCGSEDSGLFPFNIEDLERSTFCSHAPSSTTSEATSFILGAQRNSTGYHHKGVRESGAIYFHGSPSEGALLSDVKVLKTGSLLGPREDVMASWGIPGFPTWIRVITNQHGYAKTSVYVPIRCYCANTTRAGLALDIASLLDLYFTVRSISLRSILHFGKS